ncbi:GNAT family N-acetyltransferase [Acidisphaera sp. S103]|uniref:GNAT family N-acetyltransferase n=1 Tax=Acidisphaera sp. S103 TaxID=1747223 RepID=UPI00131B1A7B|nr:GNAT family N-acetyltransferase [Acidisphaera sp. S103]
MNLDWLIRSGRDADGPAVIALIWACWSAYPGVKMDVDLEMPELHALASYYAGHGGALWIAEAGGSVVGMIAVRPAGDAAWEVCRVYVDPARHGSGLGHALLDLAERHAIAAGSERLVLWSDTRFDRAHRFYEKRGYVRSGPLRVLEDISNSLEFGYAKPVNGVQALDIAAATSAEARLADILIACVAAGASVSFLPPLSRDKATAFWHRMASDVGAGKRVLLAAWHDGVMVGTGMLDLGTPENQPHRAEVQKILVHPDARRGGLGRQIMRALEQAAVAAGRSLLTLDTRAGEAGEALYRAEGWREGGRLPGYALSADGSAHDTVLFWKRVGAG